MSTFSSDRPRSKAPVVLFLLVLILAGLGAGAWYLHPRFEADPPQVTLSNNADVVGAAPIEVQAIDKGTGLKSFKAVISQGGAEQTLVNEQFAAPAAEKKFTLALAKAPGIKE